MAIGAIPWGSGVEPLLQLLDLQLQLLLALLQLLQVAGFAALAARQREAPCQQGSQGQGEGLGHARSDLI